MDGYTELRESIVRLGEHMDARFSSIDQRFTGIEQRFANLEQRIEHVNVNTSRHLVWIVGSQITVLAAVVGGLLSR